MNITQIDDGALQMEKVIKTGRSILVQYKAMMDNDIKIV